MSETLFGAHEIPLSSLAERPVLAATAWKDNAEMMLDVVRLGYLKHTDVTLDATYGRGGWWRRWKPELLVTNDLDEMTAADHHYDFRSLWCDNDAFDAVAYDPPYIAPGGRDTSTTQDFLSRFGLVTVPTTPAGVQQLIDDGLSEMYRVVKTGGVVLVKCKDYVSSGKVWWGTQYTFDWAHQIGFDVVDRFVHLAGTGPQSQTTQDHARNNFSVLYILRKP